MGEGEKQAGESFYEFKESFYYGARPDMLFKFLHRLPAGEAAEFFQSLLWKLGETADDGDADRLLRHLYEWQVRGYAYVPEGYQLWKYDEGPFAEPAKPLSAMRLGLIGTGGLFVAGHDPEPFGVKDMTQAQAVARVKDFAKQPAELTAIPMDTPTENLRVRHGGYDVRGARRDPNVVFPLERLRELRDEGVIGGLAAQAYSFVGVTAQIPLFKKLAPQWAGMMKEQQVDAVLLVPA